MSRRRDTQVTQPPRDDEVCWICLDGADESELIRPCHCPRFVHALCLARWQLQSAGTAREHCCDFCHGPLPDWRAPLTPADLTCSAPAVMAVNFGGQALSLTVQSGRGGYEAFTDAIRAAFALPEDSDLSISFSCDDPLTGSLMTLRGAGAYDAAVHCACVSAEKRQGQARAPASTCLSPACPRLLQGGDAEQLRGSELPAQRDGDSVPEGAPRGGQVGVTSEREASCMEGAWVADKGACSEGEEGADEPDDLSEVDPASLVKVEAATLLELANAAIAGSDTEADGSASSAGALGWGADDENAEAVRVPMSDIGELGGTGELAQGNAKRVEGGRGLGRRLRDTLLDIWHPPL